MQRSVEQRPMEILMIEDSLIFAKITIGALKLGGVAHRMTWLTDGAEAMEFLRRNGKYRLAPLPDMVLLDLGLPNVDGRQILAAMKADERLRNVPVVVMTASVAEDDRIESERLNVSAYMVKPIDLSKFLTLVKELSGSFQDDMIMPTY